jgi:prepilin-type N-terminal cleavage/methylation domain-containing protein
MKKSGDGSSKRAGVAAQLIFRISRGRGQDAGLISGSLFHCTRSGALIAAYQRKTEQAFRAGGQSFTSCARGGMTLIEVMVAMAIIVIVASMCVSAFMTVIGSETRETNTRLAMEKAEMKIATEAEATSPPVAVELTIGGFTLPAELHTYSETVGSGGAIATENGQMDVSGSRSYSILKGVDLPASP